MSVVYELICSNPDCRKKFTASRSHATTCSAACRSVLSRNRTTTNDFIKNSHFKNYDKTDNNVDNDDYRRDFTINGKSIKNDDVMKLQVRWNFENNKVSNWALLKGGIEAIILSKEFMQEYKIVKITKNE